ncbi:hypothetical protein VTK73DRAFT_1780 [Phialemonium thermophilum]|uniref:Uncharacterized protein n=1 Tax=Phialemonium thermophilum TaxID=223376 RepID=A0ABR3X8C9_9PEZI
MAGKSGPVEISVGAVVKPRPESIEHCHAGKSPIGSCRPSCRSHCASREAPPPSVQYAGTKNPHRFFSVGTVTGIQPIWPAPGLYYNRTSVVGGTSTSHQPRVCFLASTPGIFSVFLTSYQAFRLLFIHLSFLRAHLVVGLTVHKSHSMRNHFSQPRLGTPLLLSTR